MHKVIVSILAIAIILTASVLFWPVQADSSITWDYAQIYYSSSDHKAIAMIAVDSDAQATMQSYFDQLHDKVPRVRSEFYLEFMGQDGWELVEQHESESYEVFTLKRQR